MLLRVDRATGQLRQLMIWLEVTGETVCEASLDPAGQTAAPSRTGTDMSGDELR